ncbi:MAG: TetR/AcrR family transcriptional regulator [Heliobacteriaceae bacterium]|nr:TetR/AcrR family transcriptional regulator [Heliobacteriaceae bacterium]
MRKADQIFRGAIDVFAEKGFDRATMDEVAERAGVAKGTLYYYFKGKEDLISFLMEEGIQQLISRIKARSGKAQDPLDQLRQAIYTLVCFFDENQDFCKLLLKGIWSNADREKQFRQSLYRFYEQLRPILVAGIEAKAFWPVPVDWAVVALFGLTTIVSLRVILNGNRINRQELADYLFDQFVDGVRNRP